MKLDILKGNWIDIVFEGRNQDYGAYELRKSNTKTNVRALIIGSVFFALAVGAPLIMSLIPESTDEEATIDTKIVTVKLQPKKVEAPKLNTPPPPPPPPQQTQVKFVKPVVAKAEDVTEEPPKIEEIKDKKLGDSNIKGDPDAELTVGPVGDGPKGNKVVEEQETNEIFNLGGIEVKPDFPGGIGKFYAFVSNNFRAPEEDGVKSGKVYVNFVVEKDGSLTDIKVIRDNVGYGASAEAIRVLKKSPHWTPGIQNGKPVRVLYSLPINVEISE